VSRLLLDDVMVWYKRNEEDTEDVVTGVTIRGQGLPPMVEGSPVWVGVKYYTREPNGDLHQIAVETTAPMGDMRL
jgi:hypothetical protein